MAGIELSGGGNATWNESISALRSASSASDALAAFDALGAALANPSLDNPSCRSEMLSAAAVAKRNTWWTAALDEKSRVTTHKFKCGDEADLEGGRAADQGRTTVLMSKFAFSASSDCTISLTSPKLPSKHAV